MQVLRRTPAQHEGPKAAALIAQARIRSLQVQSRATSSLLLSWRQAHTQVPP